MVTTRSGPGLTSVGQPKRLGRIGSADLRRLLTKVALEETRLPRLIGDGPAEFSTSLAVDIWPRLTFDTNGFYRSLGASPSAKRGELSRAYLSLGGQRSVRLTKIIKTLLSSPLRRRYDATPLGMFWADDDALQHLLDEDSGCEPEVVVGAWPWAIYLLGAEEHSIDWAAVSLWRTAVIDAFSRVSGCRPTMAVGMCSSVLEPHVRLVGARLVAFLPVGLAIKDASEYARSLAAQSTN